MEVNNCIKSKCDEHTAFEKFRGRSTYITFQGFQDCKTWLNKDKILFIIPEIVWFLLTHLAMSEDYWKIILVFQNNLSLTYVAPPFRPSCIV